MADTLSLQFRTFSAVLSSTRYFLIRGHAGEKVEEEECSNWLLDNSSNCLLNFEELKASLFFSLKQK